MTSKKSGNPNGRRTLVRIMLALLLALVPVLTFAGGIPATASADQDIVAQADQQMPCHGGAGQAADAASQAGCPNCSDGDQLSQCPCCDYAVPAGLISLDLNPATAPVDGIRSRLRITDPLPESADDRLYRPPIIQS